MTRPTFFVEEDKIIDTLFDEGLDDLHIFKPSSSPIYVERLLSLLSDDYYRYITVHHHFYLKQEFGLRGIHLEQADTERPDGYKGNFSRSCSDLSMLQQSKKKSRYVFLHNIFDSISEPSLTRTSGFDRQACVCPGRSDSRACSHAWRSGFWRSSDMR